MGGSRGAPGTASRGLGRLLGRLGGRLGPLLDRLGGQDRQRATGARDLKPSWARFGVDF